MTWFWKCPSCDATQYHSPGDHIQHVGNHDVRWCEWCKHYFTEDGVTVEEERHDHGDCSVLILCLRGNQ